METDVRTFCSSMRNEMTAWNAKTCNLIRKTEEMSPSPDQKVKAPIDDMKAMIERIEETIERLEKQCPVNGAPGRTEIEQVMCDIRERWNETAAMSPDDFEWPPHPFTDRRD